jgi:polyhydroxybutyrate depolymerase
MSGLRRRLSSIKSTASAMIEVERKLRMALACVAFGVLAAACSERDIVLGERGDVVVIADPDSGKPAGSGGSAGLDASAAASGSGGSVGHAATARPSAGCGSDPVSPDDSIDISGMRASYILELPPAYDKTHAYPLLLAFRREGTSVEAFRASLNLALAVGDDAVVVYPNSPGDAATWDIQRDLPLVDALLAKFAASYCIDQDRVFAIGAGQAALLVNAFACVRSDTLRGVAPLAAVLAPAQGVCPGKAAVWLMQGSAEPSTMMFGNDNRDYWVNRNGCDASTPMAVAPAPCVAYAGCDPGFPVRFCAYDPGPELPSFTASAIWDFFSAL